MLTEISSIRGSGTGGLLKVKWSQRVGQTLRPQDHIVSRYRSIRMRKARIVCRGPSANTLRRFFDQFARLGVLLIVR